MRRFEEQGLFWVDGQETVQVAGTLSYDEETGVDLDLIGSFEGLREGAFPRAELPRTIHGIAGSKLVTLPHARRGNVNIQVPGIVRESYRADIMYSGAHVPNEMADGFTSVLVRLEHMPTWIHKTGLAVSLSTSANGQTLRRTVAEFTPIPSETANLPGGEGRVEVGFSWSSGGDRITEWYLRQGAYIEVSHFAPFPVDRAFRIVGSLRDLLSLAAHTSCAVEEITLRHPSMETMIDGRSVTPGVTVYGRLSGGGAKSVERHSTDMLFTYDQFGGAQGVALWLSLANELQPVLGSLMSLRHSPKMYAENRLLNVAMAAEALHRIRFHNGVLPSEQHAELVRRILGSLDTHDSKWLEPRLAYSNEPTLRHRLVELSEFAGAAFATIVGKPKKWAFVVSRVRNRLTHFEGSEPHIDGLYYLSESLYVLVVFCVMRMAGADDELLASTVANRHIDWLREQLPAAIKTAAAAGASAGTEVVASST